MAHNHGIYLTINTLLGQQFIWALQFVSTFLSKIVVIKSWLGQFLKCKVNSKNAQLDFKSSFDWATPGNYPCCEFSCMLLKDLHFSLQFFNFQFFSSYEFFSVVYYISVWKSATRLDLIKNLYRPLSGVTYSLLGYWALEDSHFWEDLLYIWSCL